MPTTVRSSLLKKLLPAESDAFRELDPIADRERNLHTLDTLNFRAWSSGNCLFDAMLSDDNSSLVQRAA